MLLKSWKENRVGSRREKSKRCVPRITFLYKNALCVPMPHICRWKDHMMITWCVLTYCFLCSNALHHCLSLVWETIFPKERRSMCIKKRLTARHLSQLFQATFQCFFIRGSFHQNHICNCILRCFFMCPSCNSIRAEFEGKICRLALQNAFCSAFFLITVFFLERIMVQSSCCAMQTHTMETSFEIKQITAERHYSALLCMLNIDDYGRCNFVIFTMTLG